MAKRPSFAGLGQAIRRGATAPAAHHPIDTIVDDGGTLINVPLELLDANPDQPRKYFDQEAQAELTQSVIDHGILQPIIVRRVGDRYMIIGGERRSRAAREAGLAKIPAILRQHEDPDELALIENLQREDLHPIEEAEGLFQLKQKKGFTDEILARVVGKSRKSINDSLALTRLPATIKNEWRTSAKVQKSLLLQVLRAPNSTVQLALWEQIKGGQVTVREVRKAAAQIKEKKPGPKPYHFKWQADDGRYTVRVSFRKARVSDDELREALAEALKNAAAT